MLAAGRGSNFEAIMQRIAAKDLDAQCLSLVTYSANCLATEIAKNTMCLFASSTAIACSLLCKATTQI
uniref:Uncharacterized protein n=1 Tax=uncultured bacterium contig00190 TaxID=1181604 RepID=A0A806K320_9BACT|nr:hypothetical protein [uncultured bacterium contig00190]